MNRAQQMHQDSDETKTTDYGTDQSFKKLGKVLVLRDAKSGHALHAVTLTYIEKLERNGVVSGKHREAAADFASWFHRAGLERYASINLFRVLGAPGDDTVRIENRQRIRKALQAVGPLQGSVLWHVVGCERPLDEWVFERRSAGARLNVNDARGILLAALDALAQHLGK